MSVQRRKCSVSINCIGLSSNGKLKVRHVSRAASQCRLSSALHTSPRSQAASSPQDRLPPFLILAEGATSRRTTRFFQAHSRTPSSHSPFRSPVLQAKHDIVIEFRSALERPSRWRKTEAVIHLLERLASEEGFYKAEMQLVVSQLKKDLFVELTYLPEFVQKWLETTHVETFLSSRIPYHVLSSELIAFIQRNEDENAKKMMEMKENIDAFQRAMETGNTERETLEKQLKAYQDHPMADITVGLQKEIDVLSADLKQATEHISRLKKKKVSLRLMLKRRDEFMQELVETKKTLAQQVDELTQAQVQRDIQIKRLKEQQKVLESHCTDLITQTKAAAQRIAGVEAQLMLAQNECITLKERAAVAFDELTPRPDWMAAGIVQVAPEKRKSSLECFSEMVKILHERKSSSPSRRKTKKVLSPIPA